MAKRLKLEIMVLLLLIGALLGSKADRLLGGSPYDFVDPIVDIYHELTYNYVEQPDQEALLTGAIRGMIDQLDDPYTDYLSPQILEEFDKQTRATFFGIGAEINKQGNFIGIVTPIEDSPAYNAGILAGDTILEINGETTEGLTTNEAVKRITGPEGTRVTLKVRHVAAEDEEIVEITRQRIEIQTVKGLVRDADHHWDYMIDPDQGIAYIRLTQFSEPTAGKLHEAIDSAMASGMKALILDLRFNPGGLLDQAVEIADMFLPSGVIVSSEGLHRAKRQWKAEADNDVGEFPIAVLVNEYSASASEIVAGALKDNDRAVIIGTRTWGKGSVQEIHAISKDKGAIKVTTAMYYLPSGRNLHRRENVDTWGVDPNDGFYIPMSDEQLRAMNTARRQSDILRSDAGQPAEPITVQFIEQTMADPQLAAAVRAVRGKLSDGEFTVVGRSNATLLAHMTEKANLERRRELLTEQIARIDQELDEIKKNIAGAEDGQTEQHAVEDARPTEETVPQD